MQSELFEKINKIGQGNYGHVYSLKGDFMVCKEFTEKCDNYGIHENIIREIGSLKIMEKEKYIVNILGINVLISGEIQCIYVRELNLQLIFL
jgi:hypothetical protein